MIHEYISMLLLPMQLMITPIRAEGEFTLDVTKTWWQSTLPRPPVGKLVLRRIILMGLGRQAIPSLFNIVVLTVH